jgi:hypothetical protein
LDIPIEIETQDKFLTNEMFNTDQTRQGMQTELPSGAVLRYDKTFIRKALGVPEIIYLTLQFGEEVAAGLVAAWLYDKLKDKTNSLKINNQQVPVEKKAIHQVLHGAADIKISANVSVRVIPGAPPKQDEEKTEGP